MEEKLRPDYLAALCCPKPTGFVHLRFYPSESEGRLFSYIGFNSDIHLVRNSRHVARFCFLPQIS